MSDGLQKEVEATREALESYIQSPVGAVAARLAAENALGGEEIRVVLDSIARRQHSNGSWSHRWAGLDDALPLLGRWMLVQTALSSLEKIAHLPVTSEVKHLICREYQLLVRPGVWRDELFIPKSREYRWFAQQVLLQRMVAGQLHWDVSGIPRSWLFRMSFGDALKTLSTVSRAGGFAPWFCIHLPDRGGATFLLESEFKRCHLRIAQSMELQPSIRGFMASSWLYSDETIAISPHLAWTRQFYLTNGGVLAQWGLASPDAGFLHGSSSRRALYESGSYRPRNGLIMWPRYAVLAWARSIA
jgi:hypothetical protein